MERYVIIYFDRETKKHQSFRVINNKKAPIEDARDILAKWNIDKKETTAIIIEDKIIVDAFAIKEECSKAKIEDIEGSLNNIHSEIANLCDAVDNIKSNIEASK